VRELPIDLSAMSDADGQNRELTLAVLPVEQGVGGMGSGRFWTRGSRAEKVCATMSIWDKLVRRPDETAKRVGSDKETDKCESWCW
jgi:hypothetical protein